MVVVWAKRAAGGTNRTRLIVSLLAVAARSVMRRLQAFLSFGWIDLAFETEQGGL